MVLNELEKYVIGKFLESRNDGISEPAIALGSAKVVERNFSAVGFMTEISKTPRLKILESNVSYTGCDVLVKINSEEITGYVLYIRDGFLEAIEGHTYSGHLWPNRIDSYSLAENSSI